MTPGRTIQRCALACPFVLSCARSNVLRFLFGVFARIHMYHILILTRTCLLCWDGNRSRQETGHCSCTNTCLLLTKKSNKSIKKGPQTGSSYQKKHQNRFFCLFSSFSRPGCPSAPAWMSSMGTLLACTGGWCTRHDTWVCHMTYRSVEAVEFRGEWGARVCQRTASLQGWSCLGLVDLG